MNADPFDKYVRLEPVPTTLPGERDVVPAPVSAERVARVGLLEPTPPARAFAPADAERTPAPPKVWDGGVRTLGPLLLIPGRSVHVEDLAEAEQLHRTLGEAITHLRTEFGVPAGVPGA